jgi:hypothetical protein
MTRSASGLGIAFVRNQDGLLLTLDSATGSWNVEQLTRSVSPLALTYAKALAETKGVTIAFADRSFNTNLRTANMLEVRGEGATIRVPLDGSSLALDRLEACFERNSREAERLIRSSRLVGGRSVS